MKAEIINPRVNEFVRKFRTDEERLNFISISINQKKFSKGEKKHNKRIYQKQRETQSI
jgi:hypothetical protein